MYPVGLDLLLYTGLLMLYKLPQDILQDVGLESLVLGMTSQISEREDHVVIDDLRGDLYSASKCMYRISSTALVPQFTYVRL